jgi:hypothetical protein
MIDVHDEHQQHAVFNGIDNSVVADGDPEQALVAGKRRDTLRTRVIGEPIERRHDTAPDGLIQLVQ